jgi:hypothetical protein
MTAIGFLPARRPFCRDPEAIWLLEEVKRVLEAREALKGSMPVAQRYMIAEVTITDAGVNP